MDIAAARGIFGRLWGSFQAAVNDPEVRAVPGGVQMYVWQSIRNDYLSRGESIPAGSFQAVNALLSLAGQQRAANERLQRALDTYQRTGLDQAILGDHMNADIDSRAPNAMPLGPSLRIRFEAGMIVDGQTIFSSFTWDPGLNPPQSASELLAGIEDAANTAAADYEMEYGGSAAILSITTV